MLAVERYSPEFCSNLGDFLRDVLEWGHERGLSALLMLVDTAVTLTINYGRSGSTTTTRFLEGRFSRSRSRSRRFNYRPCSPFVLAAWYDAL
jgi:hypothetical protein